MPIWSRRICASVLALQSSRGVQFAWRACAFDLIFRIQKRAPPVPPPARARTDCRIESSTIASAPPAARGHRCPCLSLTFITDAQRTAPLPPA
eukprot:2400054-Pleurochrysis_carterae.AAC.3